MTTSTSTPPSYGSFFAKHAPRKFLAVFFSILALGLGGIAGITIVVDPYDIWRVVDVGALPTRPAAEGNDRMHKAALIRREKPNALILGTSRPQVMIDPAVLHDPDGGLRVVNAAVNGSQPYDWLRLYQHASAFQRQRLLIVALDLLAFDAGATLPPSFDEGRFAVDVDGSARLMKGYLTDVPRAVLSEDALRTALSTIRRRHEPSYFTKLGQRDPTFQERDREKAGGALGFFRASERDYLGSYSCAHPFVKDGKPVTTSKGLEDFAKLLAEAQRNGTRVVAYFSPVHARHLAVIEAAGLSDANERWKAALADIVDNAAKSGVDVELFDFTAFDAEVFVEPPGGPSWWESSHATSAIGKRVLTTLLGRSGASGEQAAVMVEGELGGAPLATSRARSRAALGGAGGRSSRVAVELEAAQIRARFEAWQAEHPAELAEIQALALEVLPVERAARRCHTLSHN